MEIHYIYIRFRPIRMMDVTDGGMVDGVGWCRQKIRITTSGAEGVKRAEEATAACQWGVFSI